VLKVKEVAPLLRLSVWTVYRLIQTGALGHQRFGGAIRVTQEQLLAYMRRTEKTPKGAVQFTPPPAQHEFKYIKLQPPPSREVYVHTKLQPRRTRAASSRMNRRSSSK
jgi:excisionase family DNA binding protein